MSDRYSSAFPIPQVRDGGNIINYGENGITAREWFAAHAPAEPAEWWTPAPFNVPAPIEPALPEDDQQRRLCYDWKMDPCYELAEEHPELTAFCEAQKAYWTARDARHDASALHVAKQRSIAWRYAWADAMIEGAKA